MEAFALFRSDLVQWQSEAGISMKYNKNLFTSFMLRGYSKNTLDALIVGLGAAINESLFLMYSYDIGLSSLQNASGGAHEFLFRYKINADFGKKIPQSIIHSPRLYE
jgi:hypothetical protein